MCGLLRHRPAQSPATRTLAARLHAPPARSAHPLRPGTAAPPGGPTPALRDALRAPRPPAAVDRADGHEEHLLDQSSPPSGSRSGREASPPSRSWVPRAYGLVRGSFLVTPTGCLVVGRSGCARGCWRRAAVCWGCGACDCLVCGPLPRPAAVSGWCFAWMVPAVGWLVVVCVVGFVVDDWWRPAPKGPARGLPVAWC